MINYIIIKYTLFFFSFYSRALHTCGAMYIFSRLFETNNNPDFIKTIEMTLSDDNNCKISIEEAKQVKLQADFGALLHASKVHSFGCSASILVIF
jgi:hypothetical protein